MNRVSTQAVIEKSIDFDLVQWLSEQIGNYELQIPLIDVSEKKADEEREWLVTNGLGSYASGNLWCANSRRYHGLGVFALEPPVKRTVLLSRIDETVDGEALATNLWTSGSVSPQGYEKVVAFTIYPVPTWAFELRGGYLMKQVAMLPGTQEVVVGYTWRGRESVSVQLDFICNCRDFHAETKGWADWRFQQSVKENTVSIQAYDSAPTLHLTFDKGAYKTESDWYWNYYWPREQERGLGHREDCFHAGKLELTLEPGQSVTIHAGLSGQQSLDSIGSVVKSVAAHHNELIKRAGAPASEHVKRLVLAADQFIVERQSTSSQSIIAGYHWFGDWGRDSMISLPGLTLSTGRPEVAAGILKTFGQYLNKGMLPNNFPDSGSTPQYNTIDATLWWAWALLKFYQATNDRQFIASQIPLLDNVVNHHLQGTRYNIRVDAADGLLSGGSNDVQLTWMDAKVGDYVVTPRTGKAVEINALWYNFLMILQELHASCLGQGTDYAAMAEKSKAGFQQFWNAQLGCLYDVIAPDGSKDESIRPNQLLALSLPHELLSQEQAESILTVVERELLTDVGLRTLSPRDSSYKGRYGAGAAIADQYARDTTYHQGIAWPWLLGPWVDARINVFGNRKGNREHIATKLAPIKRHVLNEAGLGTISEIFDGDKPYHPRGCIAQAWSVAELLRVVTEYEV